MSPHVSVIVPFFNRERHIAACIESLLLEDVTASEIETDAPLFEEGLGMDSIDGLELAVAIGRKYGIKFEAGDPNNAHIFASIKSLAEFIASHQQAK